MPPNGNTATSCIPANTHHGAPSQSSCLLLSCNKPTGVVLLQGEKNEIQKKGQTPLQKKKKKIPNQKNTFVNYPGASALTTSAISYHYASRNNVNRFTSGVNLVWKHTGVTVLVCTLSRENSFFQKYRLWKNCLPISAFHIREQFRLAGFTYFSYLCIIPRYYS